MVSSIQGWESRASTTYFFTLVLISPVAVAVVEVVDSYSNFGHHIRRGAVEG